jgi:aryl-alcohol dehydrogenase-like predicted oxidoreductase
MEQRRFGNSGLSVSVLSFGTFFFRGASHLGLPYWLARGGPNAPLRSPGAHAVARSLCLRDRF